MDKVIELSPRDARAYHNRGAVYQRKGQYEQAISDYTKAIELSPRFAEAYNNRGNAYRSKGDYERAIRDYDKAIELNPRYALVHKNIGDALMRLGRTKEVVSHYRRALHLRGDWPGILNNLAWILATQEDSQIRDGAEAVRLAERACQLTNYKAVTILDTLAAAYAEVGQFEKAVETAKKALGLALADGERTLAEDIRSRLELYRAKDPYRESFSPKSISRPESK